MPESSPAGGPEPRADGAPGADQEDYTRVDMSTSLRGAFEEVVDVHARRALEPRGPVAAKPPTGWLIAAVTTWILLLFLLLFPPAFARTPQNQIFTPPTELREASLRYGLWLARQRVDAFVAREARVPISNAEAGISDRAIRLQPLGGRTYQLVGRDGSIALTLTSVMAADSFLGGSLTALRTSERYQQAGTPGRTTAR